MADTKICPDCETEIGISEKVCPSCQLDLETLDETSLAQIDRAIRILDKRRAKEREAQATREAEAAQRAVPVKKKSLLQNLGRK